MKASEAEQRFEESKRLYAQGNYGEALAILTQLDSEHPNDRHLLYPLALCLARLGRINEARMICDRLIGEFDDPKAKALRQQLAEPAPPPVGLGIPGLQPIDLGDLGRPVVKYTPPPPEPAWKSWLVYGGAVVGALAVMFLVTYVVLTAVPQGGSAGQEAASSVPIEERLANLQNPTDVNGAYLMITLLALLMSPVMLYGILALYGKLPYEEAWRNLGHVTLVTIGLTVFQYIMLRFVPCCGPLLNIVLTIVFVKRTYSLEIGEVLFWYGCMILLGIAMLALQYLALYG